MVAAAVIPVDLLTPAAALAAGPAGLLLAAPGTAPAAICTLARLRLAHGLLAGLLSAAMVSAAAASSLAPGQLAWKSLAANFAAAPTTG
jgi:hypothetical protein